MNQIVFEDDLCLDVAKHSAKAEINIQMCHFMGGNQKWNYDNKVRAGIACDAMVGEGGLSYRLMCLRGFPFVLCNSIMKSVFSMQIKLGQPFHQASSTRTFMAPSNS